MSIRRELEIPFEEVVPNPTYRYCDCQRCVDELRKAISDKVGSEAWAFQSRPVYGTNPIRIMAYPNYCIEDGMVVRQGHEAESSAADGFRHGIEEGRAKLEEEIIEVIKHGVPDEYVQARRIILVVGKALEEIYESKEKQTYQNGIAHGRTELEESIQDILLKGCAADTDPMAWELVNAAVIQCIRAIQDRFPKPAQESLGQ